MISEATSHLNIIIASGQLTPELEKKALDAGARKCLQKPLDFNIVLDELGLEAAEGLVAS